VEQNGKEPVSAQDNASKSGSLLSAPSITLPKGGGAIRGIGEKFTANPVTGTGSMTVPIATSPGRSGFGPQLSLSYDSGAGNGPFGLGWNLSLPSIARKTDKGLPQYSDAEESDVFILSGAEDLVPELRQDGSRSEDTTTDTAYTIHRYRPRIGGLFARIERWTRNLDGDIHWRSISKDNILTFYGKDDKSRIRDPNDPLRIFSWLICETRDDKGNAVVYDYKSEDGFGVDLAQAHERNRGDQNSPLRKANCYPKRIRYGNRIPLLDNEGHRPRFLMQADINNANWMFEVVFDYGEGHYQTLPIDAEKREYVTAFTGESNGWPIRKDPFSSYRAGFEVRTYRLCRRVLMFHHFPSELGDADYLVRSTDFTYDEKPIASFITGVTHSGYVREGDRYLRKSLPTLEFEYSEAIIGQEIQDVDSTSIENLPYGVDGSAYQWVDLDGEGLSGVLTEQGGGWFYKRNESALTREPVTDNYSARFTPIEQVAHIPGGNPLKAGKAQFLDLAGDGQVDLVELDKPLAGFYERTDDQDWEPFRAFRSIPNLIWNDPNLKFIDLTGDGHADVLITEEHVFTWYPSLAEEGFGPAAKVNVPTDEQHGPRVVFADGTQTMFLADLSGDGLTEIVRIRNGEICYWPNLGYGRFGTKVTMDDAPWFDAPDQFDPRRIRLADTDGSGVTDIIYLGRNQTRFWFNQSGNSWSETNELPGFPPADNIASVTAVDLLGNGTACLVWSSALPAAQRAPMKYLNLMAEGKPHLLVRSVNNLGAETRIWYAPSTFFYLKDKYDGKPWITKLPFPVHVVERVETYDRISRNRFVTHHAYHHGYFDGVEREFRGFGMVEQWDTEEFTTLSQNGSLPTSDNIDAASHVPPVHTKTWFHTGIHLGRDHVSDFFAGLLNASDKGEYYREPNLTDTQAQSLLLEDTLLPDGLTVEEEREACRALKGAMLRQEVYAEDGTSKTPHPYIITEQNFTIKALQRRGDNRHAVFFIHSREAISYHYERNPTDPRLSHALTLEVDKFGNVLKEAAIGYGRREPDLSLADEDRAKQTQIHITYTENAVTNATEASDDYRTPLPGESKTYELTGLNLPANQNRFSLADILAAGTSAVPIDYEQNPTSGVLQKRVIEHVRILYRPNDLGTVPDKDPLALLPLGIMESLALPGESYKLAFTPNLLDQVYVRSGQKLLPADPAEILEGGGAKQGGYVDLDGDGYWWIPSGRTFLSPNTNDNAEEELAHARSHFFLPHRYRDPFYRDQFNTETLVTYDEHKLLVVETRDALDNTVRTQNDYRVLQPKLVTDPNRNRMEAVFDALGLVAGTAVKGKDDTEGDHLTGLEADLTLAQINAFYEADDPHTIAAGLLKGATTRIVYDLDRFKLTGHPVFAATLARETHVSDPLPPDGLKIQISFSYSDGFGREIQKKIQAEPGPLVEGGPIVSPRWVGSGWTIFNNKGKPVRQYEPFFSQLAAKRHQFEFGVQIGVSPVLFYDPVERVVATLHPNHTWEKVIFDPWRQETWDVNDTALIADPKTDAYVGDFFRRLPDSEDYLPTWYQKRISEPPGDPERQAAEKTAVHAETPTVAHTDSLGRTCLTIAHNRFERNNALIEEHYSTRVVLDIEGNQREVIDAKDRIVMRYDYDLLGNRIHQASMEAGERWMLNDVSGNLLYAWDSRKYNLRTEYDVLRRPEKSFVQGGDPSEPNAEVFAQEVLFGKTIYGENPETGLTEGERQRVNLRGKVFRQFDAAGMVTNYGINPATAEPAAYDFKGNLLRSQRQLAQEYKATLDWLVPAAVPLETGIYASSSRFDALNRPTEQIAPDNSVYRPAFNEANLLEKVDVNLRGAATATSFVRNIDYNAKGQRTRIEYGSGATQNVSGVTTNYEYDPLTFRLTRLTTNRPAGLNGLATQIFNDAGTVQDLTYTYDPVGNITRIADDALPTLFFGNQSVAPVCLYTYDSVYRLIEAQGRESIGQSALQLGLPQATYRDYPYAGLGSQPFDPMAVRRYTEEYHYDAVGNFEQMIHQADNGAWQRNYHYEETSLVEPGKSSNRLSSTLLHPNGNQPIIEPYIHDAHGNMIAMPHLTLMQWDFKDQLQATARQVMNDNTPETTWYVYDAAGQRVRKVTERQNGTRKSERIYLGGSEVYREYGGNGTGVSLERESLHVMDDQQRIALAETRTDTPVPEQLIRYQLGNHLGSASLELDDVGQLISYEEYHPCGTTSYQAGRSAAEVSLKRYRYAGMERDEESGFNCHGVRLYAPWLARWTSPDPSGLAAGLNRYLYALGSPGRYSDSNGREPEDSVKKPAVNGPHSSKLFVLDYSSPNVCGGYRCITDEEIYTGLEQSRAEDQAAETRANKLRGEISRERTAKAMKLEAEVERTQRGTRAHRYARERLETFNSTGYDPGPHQNYGGGPGPANIVLGVLGSVILAGAAASAIAGTAIAGTAGATTTGASTLLTLEYTAAKVAESVIVNRYVYLSGAVAYGLLAPPGAPDMPGPGDEVGKSLRALGVATDEISEFAQGAKVWGDIQRGSKSLVVYFQFGGGKLTAGVLSIPKGMSSDDVVRALFTFRKEAMSMAKNLGAHTLRLEASTVTNIKEVPKYLAKRGYQPMANDPSSFFLEKPVE
jgi:RHS repeat-associated protein